MRASTAMNLGRSMLKPKAGTHWDRITNEGCAIGMIEAAAGGEYYHIFLIINGKRVPLPCSCRGTIMGPGCKAWRYDPDAPCYLNYAIIHLFNYHVMTVKDWTMDQLIDWVRSVEPPDPEEDAPKAVEQEKPVGELVPASA